MPLETATLEDGRRLQYEKVSDPPKGAMKTTYFTPDRKQVVQFYHETSAAKDPYRLHRLQAIAGKFSPVIDPATGAYFRNLFCWPTGVVTMISTTAPGVPVGETAVTVVALTTVTVVAGVVPNFTEVAAVRLVPVIVTVVPPVIGPVFGLIAVTAGAVP